MNPMMGGGPPGMPPPPVAHGLGKKRKATRVVEKLIDDNNGKIFWKRYVNNFYHLFVITREKVKKTLWFVSCLGLMYGFPMALEYFSEQ